MKTATLVKRFCKSLVVPTGRLAGKPVKLAPYQNRFIDGAFADGVNVGVLSVGRGNGKSSLSAMLCVGELLGAWSDAKEREIIIAARTQEQARIAWQYAVSFIETLPDETRENITVRRQPRFEIQYDDGNGPHLIKAISADGKSALGSSPTLAVLDERGHWPLAQGDELEAALLTGLSKRDGKALIISTSAPNDMHPLSLWLDREAPGVYRQEHRPTPNLPVDDADSLVIANPGSKYGIGPTLTRLKEDAALVLARGGSAVSRFRLLSRNERVSEDNRDALLDLNEWLGCETDNLPPRQGQVVIGLDLGETASMSAVAYLWPDTGRLEAWAAVGTVPTLEARGQADSVGDLYSQMHKRGELALMGNKTVPPADWMRRVLAHVEGETIASIVGDRFKQSQLGDALTELGNRSPVVWRGMGFKDGSEDVERFRRYIFDGNLHVSESYLLRHAIGEAAVFIDPAGNSKIVKGRSMGRIDAACAAVLAVAEASRIMGRPQHKGGRLAWG
ncbi:MAG: terminase large subunit [Erythrobacter sp.]|uniref:terminase TerL endonuclease subunit n=1 Tax=Erythrobacter sp. TaxID=1042 RepID=UPI0026358400|nr:terminase TerL endonuclease subunit [Erythrobacter sp.]MDJ0979254.1 terminase large subunit [Erythrobacter sp.]